MEFDNHWDRFKNWIDPINIFHSVETLVSIICTKKNINNISNTNEIPINTKIKDNRYLLINGRGKYAKLVKEGVQYKIIVGRQNA